MANPEPITSGEGGLRQLNPLVRYSAIDNLLFELSGQCYVFTNI
jgi:hypothetical protein